MYIGVDIGGSKIRVAAADLDNKVVSQQKIETPKNREVGLEAVVDLIHAVAKQHDISAIGAVAPGQLNWDKGEIGDSPNLNWKGAAVVKTLEKNFRVPVAFENDANAAALAEARLGAGKGQGTVLYVGIGTGVGTGLVIDHQIYRGANDLEGGHMVIKPNGDPCGCGGRGHFETLVSGPAMERRFGAPAGKIIEVGVWDEYSRDLAQGLVNLVCATSPGAVVIGGGMSVHWNKFIKPLTQYMADFYRIYPVPKVVPAHFRETASVYGAILLAQQTNPRS